MKAKAFRVGINSLKWITSLYQEHCRNTSDYWGDGISAFLYHLAKCQGMLFPVVGDRWLGRIGSVIEIMHFYCFTSPQAVLLRDEASFFNYYLHSTLYISQSSLIHSTYFVKDRLWYLIWNLIKWHKMSIKVYNIVSYIICVVR